MDRLTALIALLLSLFGCDGGASRFVHHDRVDGVDRLHAEVVLDAGRARLDCLASRGGRCRFRIADAACDARTIAPCASPVVVLVVDGSSARIDAPAAVDACVDVPGDATARACRSLGAAAPRR